MKANSLRTVKIAKQAGIITAAKPVDSNGVIPSEWSKCVGYELEGVIDLDLIAAVDAGVKTKKLKPSEKLTKSQLETRLITEKIKAKSDREKTPSQVKVDDPLKEKP